LPKRPIILRSLLTVATPYCAVVQQSLSRYIYIYIYISPTPFPAPHAHQNCRTHLIKSFQVFCLFYRALLPKRPIILRSLLTVATPYSARTPELSYTSNQVFFFCTRSECVHRRTHKQGGGGNVTRIMRGYELVWGGYD